MQQSVKAASHRGPDCRRKPCSRLASLTDCFRSCRSAGQGKEPRLLHSALRLPPGTKPQTGDPAGRPTQWPEKNRNISGPNPSNQIIVLCFLFATLPHSIHLS